MRKFLQIVGFAIPLLLACNGSSKVENDDQNKSHLDSVKKDSIDVAKKYKVDENKVIGNMVFGISEAEYKKREAEFFKETKYKPWIDSNIERNKIGDYKFDSIDPFFNKNMLYQVVVNGNRIHYEKYDAEMNEQVTALKTMLVGKYGEPHEGVGVPEWHTTQKDYTYLVYGWQIGAKTIEMRVANNGLYFQLQLQIFQPAIVKLLENAEADKKMKNAEKAKNAL